MSVCCLPFTKIYITQKRSYKEHTFQQAHARQSVCKWFFGIFIWITTYNVGVARVKNTLFIIDLNKCCPLIVLTSTPFFTRFSEDLKFIDIWFSMYSRSIGYIMNYSRCPRDSADMRYMISRNRLFGFLIRI